MIRGSWGGLSAFTHSSLILTMLYKITGDNQKGKKKREARIQEINTEYKEKIT